MIDIFFGSYVVIGIALFFLLWLGLMTHVMLSKRKYYFDGCDALIYTVCLACSCALWPVMIVSLTWQELSRRLR
jgi:uncharacterized membrane protein